MFKGVKVPSALISAHSLLAVRVTDLSSSCSSIIMNIKSIICSYLLRSSYLGRLKKKNHAIACSRLTRSTCISTVGSVQLCTFLFVEEVAQSLLVLNIQKVRTSRCAIYSESLAPSRSSLAGKSHTHFRYLVLLSVMSAALENRSSPAR